MSDEPQEESHEERGEESTSEQEEATAAQSILPPTKSLAEAAQLFGIALEPEILEGVDRYVKVLWEWNEKINLTRHTDYSKFVARDLLDCVQLAALLDQGEEILDVGSGGGVPGIVLNILRPDLQVSICDSVGKKAKVLKEIVKSLGLAVAVYDQRAESVLEEQHFDAVTARAVGPMVKMLKWFQPHWPAIGRLLLIKGPKWLDERGEARHYGMLNNLECRKAAEYEMPGSYSNSVIIKLWPKTMPEK
jgi:16S rRNA (guanine527-N7)-methyltransferase